MLKHFVIIGLIGSLLFLTVPATAFSQTKQEQKTAKVKEKIKKLGIGERVKIKVKTYAGTTYQGYVSGANDDDFVVADKNGNPNTIKYTDVDKVGGHNLSTGAKIGIGIAIGVGAVFAFIGILVALIDD